MCTLIWNCVDFVEEAKFLLIVFFEEERLDCRREFKEALKCLSKRNRVRVWSEIGYEILG